MPELLLALEKTCLATAQGVPQPEQMSQSEQLWKLLTSDVPQRLYVACMQLYWLSSSKHAICILCKH